MKNFRFAIFARYEQELSKWFDSNQERLAQEGIDEETILEAKELYHRLAAQTSEAYFSRREDLFDDADAQERFVREISALQDHVLEGKIAPIAEEFEMSREEAIEQCARANQAFSERPDLQKLLADANYSYFTRSTMATAKDLLDLDLDDYFTEGMPHLTASNAAIGHLVKNYVLERVSQGEASFTITDIGSGSGATLAGLILGLAEVDKKIEDDVAVRIVSLEGCRSFYDALEEEMLPAIGERNRVFDNVKVDVDLRYADIGNHKFDESCGTSIFTSNYVFHRLSDDVKAKVCEEIGGTGSRRAFFLADIYRNTSQMPNRRYFNFALNGPLNPGNDIELMRELMQGNGFRRVTGDDDGAVFGSLPRAIVDACTYAKQHEQGFLVAGYDK